LLMDAGADCGAASDKEMCNREEKVIINGEN
jgi:hypothetical protein